MARKGQEAGIVSSGQSTKQCTGHLRLSADTQSDLTPSQGPWLIPTTGPTNQAAIDRCTDPKGSLGDAKGAFRGTPVVSPPVLLPCFCHLSLPRATPAYAGSDVVLQMVSTLHRPSV